MLRGSLDGRGVWERMDTCICMAESLCCSPETLTTLLIGYTPIQNKKLKKNLKERSEKERDADSSQILSGCSIAPLGLSWKWKLQSLSLQPHGLYSPQNSPGQNTGLGSLKWVTFPFSRGPSQARDQSQVFRISGRFFTSWATGKPQVSPGRAQIPRASCVVFFFKDAAFQDPISWVKRYSSEALQWQINTTDYA